MWDSEDKEKGEEEKLLEGFMKSKAGRNLSGNFLLEVPIGWVASRGELIGNIKPKRIDVVCVKRGWVVARNRGIFPARQFTGVSVSKAAELEARFSGRRFTEVWEELGGLDDLPEVPVKLQAEDCRWLLRSLEGASVWLLEGKRRINAEVLGQILINKFLFKEDYPNLRIEGVGVVCKERDKIIERICKEYGINKIWALEKLRGGGRRVWGS